MNRFAIFLLLMFIAPASFSAKPAVQDAWKRNLAFGYNLTSGNSDTALFNVDAGLEKKGGINEFRTTISFAYGEVDNETTEENGELTAQYNRLFAAETYFYINTEAKSDNIALIDYRIITGPGIGHYFLKSEKMNFSLELGASVLVEDLAPAAPVVDLLTGLVVPAAPFAEKDDAIVYRLVQRFDMVVSDSARLWQSAEYLPEADDFDAYLLNAEIGLEAVVSKLFSLRVVVEDRYDNRPVAGVERNDVVIKSALVVNI